MSAVLRVGAGEWLASDDVAELATRLSKAIDDGSVVTLEVDDGHLLLNGAAATAVSVSEVEESSWRTSKMGRQPAPGGLSSGAADSARTSKMGRLSAAGSPTDAPVDDARTSKMGLLGTPVVLSVGGSTWGLADAGAVDTDVRDAMGSDAVVQFEITDAAQAPGRLVVRGWRIEWVWLSAGVADAGAETPEQMG